MTAVGGDKRELAAIERLRGRLKVGRGFAAGDVDAAVERAVKQFAGAPIRDFVPMLVERLVLADLRSATGHPPAG